MRIQSRVVDQDVDGVCAEPGKCLLDDTSPGPGDREILLHTSHGNTKGLKLGCKCLGWCPTGVGNEADGYVGAAGRQLTGYLRTDASGTSCHDGIFAR